MIAIIQYFWLNLWYFFSTRPVFGILNSSTCRITFSLEWARIIRVQFLHFSEIKCFAFLHSLGYNQFKKAMYTARVIIGTQHVTRWNDSTFTNSHVPKEMVHLCMVSINLWGDKALGFLEMGIKAYFFWQLFTLNTADGNSPFFLFLCPFSTHGFQSKMIEITGNINCCQNTFL